MATQVEADALKAVGYTGTINDMIKAYFKNGLVSAVMDGTGNVTGLIGPNGQPISLGVTGSIVGSPSVGTVINYKLPTGVTANLAWTRTLIASPYTKTYIAGATGTGVNSLNYTVLQSDVGYSLACEVSSIVSAGSGVAAIAAAVGSYDVIVYGASWPGVCAAIRAKQQGRTVLLVDTRDVIGGMTRSGLQFTDAITSPVIWRATIPEASLSNSLFSSLAAQYSIGQNVYYRDYSYASESKTTGTVIDTLLSNAGITPVTNQELLSLVKSGTEIVSATFSGIGTVQGKQWIDASYTGDLTAKSGATYYMGGEAVGVETAQQAGFVIAGSQPTNAVDPYINPGVPGSGLIKYVQNYNASSSAVGAAVPGKVQFPGFRLSITNTPGKKTVVSGGYPFPLPADAIPGDYASWPSKANYELHRRDALLNKTTASSISNFLNLQSNNPAIPSKTSGMTNKRDANNNGQFSLDFPDVALNTEYFTPGTTRARRLEIEDIAWQYTLGFLYFLCNDPAIPTTAQTDIKSYGFVNDDYIATGGRPPLMYPRETIRVVGDTPINATTITAANNAVNDPCCLAYYAFDKHPRQFIINTVSTVDRVIQEGGTPNAVLPSAVGARISSTVLNPQKTQVSNLQCVTTPNGTQMFYNSYRVEPLMANAAEFAGIRAALAVATSTPVQDVPWASVAAIQNLYGLDPVGGTCATVDGVTRTQGTVAFTGTWNALTSTNICGTTGIRTCNQTSGVHTVVYTPQVPSTGTWKIQVKYLDSSPNGVTRGTLTTAVTIGGTTTAGPTLNQNSGVAAANVNTNGDWQTLYTGTVTQGDYVTLTHVNSTNSSNVAAFRLVP